VEHAIDQQMQPQYLQKWTG